MASNETFKSQLVNQLGCTHVSMESVRKLRYIREDIVNFVQHFNSCQGDGTVNKPADPYRVRTCISLRLGLGYYTYGHMNSVTGVNDTFGPAPSLRRGLEAEFVMPFGRNKWGLATEVAYEMFKLDGVSRRNVSCARGLQHS